MKPGTPKGMDLSIYDACQECGDHPIDLKREEIIGLAAKRKKAIDNFGGAK